MATKPSIAIVGPGRLGSTLAVELKRAGYRVREVVSRNTSASQRKARQLARRTGSRATTAKNARLDADVVWFCVPDREISDAARELAAATQWKGKTAFHSSGALLSDELNALRRVGAAVASVHPMMTFVRGAIPSLKDVPFAVEGDVAAVRVARRIAKDLGGRAFTIRKQNKVAYHAWGTFASPLLVAALVTAEKVARQAGLSAAEARRNMLPIVRQTVENYARLGPAGAFSGPIVRGDVAIVRAHLQMLKKVPGAKEVYATLARLALRHLPTQKRAELGRVLGSRARQILGAVEVGDKVRVKEIPSDLREQETRAIFQRCLGKVFSIAGFQKGLIELEVGRAIGRFPAAHSIWVEPEFLERVDDAK
jgi:predicted short-subunit dehydrogenase-like oxidoreductase (DUF2520 family)